MCAIFWGAEFGGCPSELTRLRVAVVSGSTKIEMTCSKNLFQNSEISTELHYCVEFKPVSDKK